MPTAAKFVAPCLRAAASRRRNSGGTNPVGLCRQDASAPGASGFSLIEVLVAILILGVALAGLTRGITTALSSSKESEVQTTAAMIAASLVESMRVEGGLLDGETEGSFGGGLALYHWKESVTASQIDGLHEVKVVVSHAKTGQTIYELQTLLFEPTADTFQKDKDKKGGKKKGGARG